MMFRIMSIILNGGSQSVNFYLQADSFQSPNMAWPVISGITGRPQGPEEKDYFFPCSCFYEQENPFLVPHFHQTKLHCIPGKVIHWLGKGNYLIDLGSSISHVLALLCTHGDGNSEHSDKTGALQASKRVQCLQLGNLLLPKHLSGIEKCLE